jgi:hypothetical protein
MSDSAKPEITCTITIDSNGQVTTSPNPIPVPKKNGATKIVWQIATANQPTYSFDTNVAVLLPVNAQFNNGKVDSASQCSVTDVNSNDQLYPYMVVYTPPGGTPHRHDPGIRNGST